MAPAYLRRNQVDVLDELPELIEVEDWVLFGDQDSGAYRQAVAGGNFMAMRQAAYSPATRAGSAKLNRLVEIVEEAEDGGAKVLVFSYFRGVLDTIRGALPGKVFGPLTGSTGTANRQRIIDEFTAHSGSAVLLAQIEAGGVGLNIQAASVVILAEPQWKPSTEAQAIARAHRMGQIRTVQVHRLLAKGSVDELMRSVLAKKSDLFDEYARRSEAKESDVAAIDAAWDGGVAPTEQDFVRAEQRRLGLGGR
ncbi:C-terminal helicase domain-containing protein [Rhodococcus opacus]|uniref:helicase-related protein n=1 Tax=Rhodococcus opacus TaxID=37919 RepID=UPI0002EAFE29|nr:C-terminal helicase domain-containing protein [Rhodococcus opacus]